MQESNSIANANKFTPKPGDKIICNNGEEFICCTLEFLHDKISGQIRSSLPILGYYKTENDEYWQDWNEDGTTLCNDFDYGIREVIPVESKEDDPRYTVEEVTDASANALHLSWVHGRQEGIDKVKDYLSKKHNTEYQEYLRLKAIYE